MNRITKAMVTILGAGFLGSVNAETTVVWTTDYSSKPPYHRTKETVKNVDLARFETQKETIVSNVDFRGKPPYKRNREVVRVVDLAQFEIAEDSKFIATPRRHKN